MDGFPKLFATSKAGKKQEWQISVKQDPGSHAVIETVYGYVGGKLTTHRREITSGKNIGKKNETTPLQQAYSEAKADYNKKVAAGYAPEGAPTSEASSVAVADQPLLPMLAHDYHKHPDKLKFPCYAQPKLDGVRALYRNGKFYSRTGKEFLCLQHLQKALEQTKGLDGLVLDGEIFTTELTFQEISGLVRKKTPVEKCNQLEFWVYDAFNPDDLTIPFEKRFAMLDKLLETFPAGSPVKLLHTETLTDATQLKPLHDEFVAPSDSGAGFEGLIVRNAAGLYNPGNRSHDLLKFKEFQDAEYKIVGFAAEVATLPSATNAGLVLWNCETPEGSAFTVRPRGSHAQRAEMLKNAKKAVGKLLTVRFQELTNDGIPRFPVGIGIRDYE